MKLVHKATIFRMFLSLVLLISTLSRMCNHIRQLALAILGKVYYFRDISIQVCKAVLSLG